MINKMKKLIFRNKFDAIVCLNAEIPDKSFFEMHDVPLIAADGAAILLYRKGIIPDIVIGDLDSFYSEKEHVFFNDKSVIHITDQETNDFEKALNYCINNDMKKILIVGFHGGELEHSLNNWSIFFRYSKKADICIFDHERYGISINQSFSLDVKIGEMISIIPEPSAILKTTGLKWELNDETLTFGMREGARNEAVSTRIEIEIISGDILLFINSQLPYSPEFI
jgi:thiamine pyrophosphokinase